MSSRTSRWHDESGAAAIIVAVSMVLMFTVAATVIDLGLARADVRQNQSISDFAALAATDALDVGYVAACQSALNYVYANADELAAPPPSDVLAECSSAFSGLDSSGCSAGTDRIDLEITAGPYVITVSSPVPDDAPEMTDEQSVDASLDGVPCERIAIQVDRDRDYVFATVAGFTSGTATADAVARQTIEGYDDEYSSLVILDRSGCSALYASGQGSVWVRDLAGSPPTQGTITLDTLGTGCGSPKYALRVSKSSTDSFVRAEGAIRSYGLQQGTPVEKIYDEDLLADGTAADGGAKISLKPIAGRLITRSPVDHLFNCLSSYGTPGELWQPSNAIEACPEAASRPAYVKEMVAALQSSGTPAGYRVFPDDVPGASCTEAAPRTVDGDAYGDFWRIACPSTGQAFNPGDLTFKNVRVVVSDNRVNLNSTNALTITGRSGKGAIFYVRNGGIAKGAQGTLALANTFVYVHNGAVDVGAGPQTTTWRGPLDSGGKATCVSEYGGTGLPPAACFSPLALWSNSAATHTLGGQGQLQIAGTFFTPNAAPFVLGGQGGQLLDEAQFFSHSLHVSGQGTLTLVPNPNTNVPTPVYGTGLIR